MSDVFAHLDGLPAGAMKDEIFKLARTEGVTAAIRAAIDVLNDKHATAAARATMASLMFRLAGYLEKPTEAEDPFDVSTLTPAQLNRTMQEWKDEIAQIENKQRRDVFA